MSEDEFIKFFADDVMTKAELIALFNKVTPTPTPHTRARTHTHQPKSSSERER